MKERELPDGWEMTTFRKCCKSIRYGVGMPPEYSDDGVPFIRATNVKKGTISEKNLKYVSIVDSKTIEKCRIKEGNLIVVRSGVNTGDCAFVPKKFDGALAGFDLIVEFDNHESAKFFNFFINSRYGTSQIDRLKRRAAQEHLNSEQLSSLKVPNPPIALKRQIVALLEQAEAVKRQRQEADAMTGALLQSIFLEMFGDTARNDRGWDVVKIRDVTEKSQYGCSVLGTNEGQYPIIGMNNLTYEGKIDLKKLKYVNLSEKEFENFKLECGDVLFNRTNAPNLVGKTGLFQNGENFVFASYLIRLKLKMDIVDPQYLWTFLNSPYMKNKFSGMCKKAVNQANINAQELQNISIPLPPLALQQQFARIVQDVERIRERQVASGRHMEGLCEGLMQRAFAGELAA